ncbi:MAG: hypothetical protein ACKOPK_13675, partial [Dolichospermum sp.]
LYTGHPLFLKTITISIKKIFNGKVSEFLAENELVITQEMQSLFSQIFNNSFGIVGISRIEPFPPH